MRRRLDPHRYPIFPNDRRAPGLSGRAPDQRRARNFGLLASIAGLLAITVIFLG